MRQRLVLRFDTCYEDYNSRSDAMKAVVGADGVTSVILDEKDKTRMEVIGEEMDVNELLNILKKKIFKTHMEKLEKIKHEKKKHHEKDKKKEHHHHHKEEGKHKKDKKKKEKKDKKNHRHSYSDSDSGSGSSSSSGSDSESDWHKKRAHHHNHSSSSSSSSSSSRSDSDSDTYKRDGRHHRNQTTYIYRPTYPPQTYPAASPYENGYNYKYPTDRYSEGYNQDSCSLM